MTQEWAAEIVGRVGGEVRRLRTQSKPTMTAQRLSERTADLGHVISRSVIADLENGRRRSLDIGDLVVLAAALQVAPIQLLYPDLPRGAVEALPGCLQESHAAMQWFGGESGLMKPHSGWAEADTGDRVDMWIREGFDTTNDRVTVTRSWLKAVASMRHARMQVSNAIKNRESPDQIEAMQYVYENARDQSIQLFSRMAELQMTMGQEGPFDA